MIVIYVLEKNGIPFYIGKCNNINVRYNQHKKTFGNEINLKILELVENKDWKDKERYYISFFKSRGYKLENKNNGGGGPTKLDIISKQRISNSKIGKNYKLKNISNNIIEELYKTNTIKEISKKLNLSFYTVKKYLVNKNLYIKHKNKPKITEITKEKFKNRPHRKGKQIIQLDKNDNIINEFSSITEACIKINKPKREGDISACCNGKQKTAFGYKWKLKKIE